MEKMAKVEYVEDTNGMCILYFSWSLVSRMNEQDRRYIMSRHYSPWNIKFRFSSTAVKASTTHERLMLIHFLLYKYNGVFKFQFS